MAKTKPFNIHRIDQVFFFNFLSWLTVRKPAAYIANKTPALNRPGSEALVNMLK